MKYKFLNLLFVAFVPLCMSAETVEKSTQGDVGQRSALTLVERQLQVIDQEEETLEKYSGTSAVLEAIAADIEVVKKELATAINARKDFLQKRSAILSKIYQVYTEISSEVQQIFKLLQQEREFLKAYDPDFSAMRISRKTAPSFADLQELTRRLQEVKARIIELDKNKATITKDVQRRRAALGLLQTELDAKLEQRSAFASGRKTDNSLSQQEQGILLDEDVRYVEARKELQMLKIKRDELQLSFIDTQLAAARTQNSFLKDDFTFVKRALIIDQSQMKEVEDSREAERERFVELREGLNERVRSLLPVEQKLRQKLDEDIARYALSPADVTLMREWLKEPKSIKEWHAIVDIGKKSAAEAFLETERDFLNAHMDLSKAKLKDKEIDYDIARSWQKIVQRSGFKQEEDIEQDIKKYSDPRNELMADLGILVDKRDTTINLLHELNITLDRVKHFSDVLRSVKESVFKNNPADYNEIQNELYSAEGQIRKRIDLTAKLVEVYSTTMATISDILKKIEDVVAELTNRSFWRRSEQSIDWNELQNFVPDIERFFRDLKTQTIEYISYISPIAFLKSLPETTTLPEAFAFFIHLIIALVIFALLKLYLLDFKQYLIVFGSRYPMLSNVITFFGLLIGFLHEHLVSFYAWLVLFVTFYFGVVDDVFLAIAFYLFSIPYLILLVASFMRFLVDINKQRGYVFMSEDYQRRFSWVFSIFAYSTITLLFFREAFLLGHYFESQVPAILLAVNFIILQIALISLISKEHIMSLIPENTPLWEWIKEHVDKYYYVLFLAFMAMIVMSNPYVGYGKQVFYFVTNLLLTILLFPLLSWFYNRVKHAASDLFFYYSDNEALKERFAAGRNWYGLFVVFTFIFLVMIGLFIAAKLWGYSISPRKILAVLNYELYSPGINEATGKPIQVTLMSLSKVFLFVVGGLCVTYIINQFILKRIFDPLLLGPGVQNTILTLTRYIVFVFAFFIGLQSAGLDALTTKLVLVVGGIAYVLSEPLRDFFSYFIILVQRPIKIGDLIMIDQDTMGVVRQITPRSTILRRRNSTTLVVPNSSIITRTVINWNYTRTFFAFEDMLLTVPYNSDPEFVRKIILQVLDDNINVLKTPQPIVWLHDFVDNGYQFLVRGYLTADKVLDQWHISSEVRLEIVKRLRAEGLEIASPTRSIKIVRSDGSVEFK